MAEEKKDLRPEAERSAQDLRDDLAARRESISHAVDRLNERLHETLEWRRYVREHPLAALGVAAGAGLLVSGLMWRRRRRSPSQRIADAIAGSFEELTDSLREVIARWPAGEEKKPSAAAAVTAAVGSMAGRVAMDFVKRKVTEASLHRTDDNGAARSASGVGHRPEFVS